METDRNNVVEPTVKIVVCGVGGGGCNAVTAMKCNRIAGVKLVAMNTDRQALEKCRADCRLQIGQTITNGLGAGSDPTKGSESAKESEAIIRESIQAADLVFVTAGMGGGTGTGAAPVVASYAKEMGKLTIGVVTLPFTSEGPKRMANAQAGLNNLRKHVDAVVVIANQKLLELGNRNLNATTAFEHVDRVLLQCVCSISDLITNNQFINIDFADICSVLRDSGVAHIGVGRTTTESDGLQALKNAVSSPLMTGDIDGATGVILNVSTGPQVPLAVTNDISKTVSNVIDPNAIFKFGIDPRKDFEPHEIVVTIITASPKIGNAAAEKPAPTPPVQEPKQPEPPQVNNSNFPPYLGISRQPSYLEATRQIVRKRRDGEN